MITADTSVSKRIASTLASRLYVKSPSAITGYSKTDDYRPIRQDLPSPNPEADRELLLRLRSRAR